jgi:hypothetical protein
MRPNGEDPDSCLWDIWSLERFGPGKAPGEAGRPAVKRELFEHARAFKGRKPFPEEDVSNMIATRQGMLSRGFSGARTNPVLEVTVSNFHEQLYRYHSG